MRVNRSLTFVLFIYFSLFYKINGLECSASEKYWCGNACGGFSDLCTCGDRNVTNGEEGCCLNYQEESCFNGNQSKLSKSLKVETNSIAFQET